MNGDAPDRVVPEMPGIQVPREAAEKFQFEVADLLQRKSRSFPGSQPVSFARKHIKENLLAEDYYVCEKSDGIRCLLYLTEDPAIGEAAYLINRNNEYFFVDKLHFPTLQSPSDYHKHSLIDGELVISHKKPGEHELEYLMYDIMVYEGKLLTKRPLDKRLGYMKNFIDGPLSSLRKDFPDDVKEFPFKARMKDLHMAHRLDGAIQQLPNLSHVSDGLILTPKTTPYVFGTDPKLLKWKPPEENTVDFKLSMEFPTFTDPDMANGQVQDEKNGKSATYPVYDAKPKCKLQVWQGGNVHEDYAELYLEDSEWESLKALNEPLQGRIVESFKDDERRWRYMRFRDDKQTGNHISTVEKVIESINDKVTADELISMCPQIRVNFEARENAERRKRSSISESSDQKRARNE